MRVIVWGGDGPLAARLTDDLAGDRRVREVVTLAPSTGGRRRWSGGTVERRSPGTVEVRRVDPAGNLSRHLRFADALVLLPSGGRWDRAGRRRRGDGAEPHRVAHVAHVASQAAESGVRVLVHCSTAAVYAAAPPGQAVDERWPTGGRPACPASTAAAAAERAVDRVGAAHPAVRTVRLRAGFVVTTPDVGRAAGDQAGRSPASPLRRLVALAATNRRLRLVPDLHGSVVQPLHVDDLARAVLLALTGTATGTCNVASDPVDTGRLAAVFDARPVHLPRRAAIGVLRASGRLGLHAVDVTSLVAALGEPVMTTGRARRDLGWRCEHPSGDVLVAWAAELARSRPPPDARWRAARTGPSGGPGGRTAVEGPGSGGEATAPGGAPATLAGLRSLHEQAVAYVGSQVRTLGDDDWHAPTAEGGRPVWEVVAGEAREQYRLAMLLRDDPPAAGAVESLLPDDPLGFSRADGWDLAAERARETLGALDGSQPADRPPGTAATRALPDAICRTARVGTVVAEATGGDATMPGDLAAYVSARTGMSARTGASASPEGGPSARPSRAGLPA